MRQFIICGMCAAFGFLAGGTSVALTHTPAPIVRPVAIPQPDTAMILGCPITKARLEEWGRVCRARKRLESIKGK